MIKQSFTQEQIKKLLKNENVLKFSGTYIAYTPEFKSRAVNQYLNEGMTPKEIFIRAGFDLTTMNVKKPGYQLHDWAKVFKAKGDAGFTIELRGNMSGSSKRFETLTDSEKIQRLALENRYLKKENHFLANLRARKAE